MMSQRIMQEARNALSLNSAQTPLIGGENPQVNELYDVNQSGQAIQTPNPLKRGPISSMKQSEDGLMPPPSKRTKGSAAAP